jgi:hypothetical protein
LRQEYIYGDQAYAVKISESPLGYIWDRTFYIYGADKKLAQMIYAKSITVAMALFGLTLDIRNLIRLEIPMER